MQQLEQIVKDLESGQLPLEAALKKFEEGIKLSRFCSERLDEIEKKITILVQNQGIPEERPFFTENEADDE